MPAKPLPGFRYDYRLKVFDDPRAPWRDTREQVMQDAIRLGLASWDASKRQHFLAVPVAMERRSVPDPTAAHPSRRNRHREAWTGEDIALLRRLAKEGEPLGIAALKLGRSSEACATKARRHGIEFRAGRRR
jgi:hypothetical protein